MKKLLGIASACLLFSGAWAQPVYWDFNGHYYEVVPSQGIAWADARAAALGMWHDGLRAHLATVTSQEELDFLNSVIAGQGLNEMYIGGYQVPLGETDRQAGWTWVNDEGWFPGYDNYPGMPGTYDPTIPFAHWNSGEPNDAHGVASEQWLGIGWNEDFFNDEGALGNINGFIVEYDPTTIDDVNVPDIGSTASLFGGALAVMAMFSRRARKAC